MYVCPKRHLSLRKSNTHTTSAGRKYPTEMYYFDVEKCKRCSNRDGYYKAGSKSKSITISLKKDKFKEHQAFMEIDLFKKRYKERYKVEEKNSELKNNYGLDKTNGRGILGVSILYNHHNNICIKSIKNYSTYEQINLHFYTA